MKILHVITGLNRGGAENQLLTLVNQQVKQGHQVEVVALRNQHELIETEEVVEGFKVHLFGEENVFITFVRLWKVTLKNDFEIIHAHLPRAELVCALVALLSRKPLVISKHNAERFKVHGSERVSRFLAKFVERVASRIILISNSVESFLEGIDEISAKNKSVIVPYSFDPAISRWEDSALVTSTCSKDFKVIGTISRLTYQKNLTFLLRLFEKAVGANQSLKLAIIGRGEDEFDLKKLAQSLGIDRKVQWHGNIPHRLQILANLDVFVLTSHYEGFGLVLLEAMQLGVPILASRTSAIPEVLGEEFVGLFEPENFDDALEKLDSLINISKTDRVKLEEYYMSRLQLFEPRLIEKRIYHVYSSLVGKK